MLSYFWVKTYSGLTTIADVNITIDAELEAIMVRKVGIDKSTDIEQQGGLLIAVKVGHQLVQLCRSCIAYGKSSPSCTNPVHPMK